MITVRIFLKIFAASLLRGCMALAALALLAGQIQAQPPFTDADWISFGGYPAFSGPVNAIVVKTNLGAVYVGGNFSAIGSAASGGLA